jgi:hypothetical protein
MTKTSILLSINSVTSAGSLSDLRSEYRVSIARFCPSIHPSSRRLCVKYRNAAQKILDRLRLLPAVRDPPHAHPLLRTRDEWPRHHGTETNDKLPPLHVSSQHALLQCRKR